jgi:hypothetical protein
LHGRNIILTLFIDWAPVEKTHQDGGKHWHVFLLMHHSLQTRDHTAFNIKADRRMTLHPNIRVSKCTKEDLKKIWAYMNKTETQLLGMWEWQEASK